MKLLLQFIFVIFLVHVLSVHDGDTIKVIDRTDGIKYTVRMARIDAPEITQEYGKEAQAYLSKLILNKDIKIQLIQGDFHGPRIDCEAFLIDGTNVNLEMVKSGNAWWYAHFDPDDNAMQSAQALAQAGALGLWAQSNPVAPWDFRKQNKEVKK